MISINSKPPPLEGISTILGKRQVEFQKPDAENISFYPFSAFVTVRVGAPSMAEERSSETAGCFPGCLFLCLGFRPF